MSEKVGIAIIGYHSLPDVQRAVESVQAHTILPFDLVVWDNTENWTVGEWCHVHDGLTYIRSHYNVGTCISRNKIWERWLSLGICFGVVMDGDVAITAPGWTEDMLSVFAQYPDTGIVSWKFLSDQLCNQPIGEAGLVPQVAGSCCMLSAMCVRVVGGWHTDTLYFRMEDSDFCFQAGLKGFKCRLVMGEQKIAHPNPSSGLARQSRDAGVRALSEAIFQQRAAQYGYPRIEGVSV